MSVTGCPSACRMLWLHSSDSSKNALATWICSLVWFTWVIKRFFPSFWRTYIASFHGVWSLDWCRVEAFHREMQTVPGQNQTPWTYCVCRWYFHWPREDPLCLGMPVPQNISQLQSFLDFVGFYRRFSQNFSQVSHPLYELLKGPGCNKKKQRRKSYVASKEFVWQEQQQWAFDKLVNICFEAPVLAYADYTKPFIVHTDASMGGFGAVLLHTQGARAEW